jgi:GT2 family glycosyltransferase
VKPIIGIVTVLYNSESVLEDFFSSLNIQTYQNFILYVVDNKSQDHSLPISKRLSATTQFKSKVIENKENYGVAKGNNIGIEQALNDGCKYVLLSNNDVVIENNAIESLLKGLELHNARMAVPKIYLYDTTLFWAAGGYFKKITGRNYHRGRNELDVGQYQVDEQIETAPTCFMLIRSDIFNEIGTMDENYFVYWDDTDFVYRATSHGFPLWYIPESIVYHKEGTSTGLLSDFSVRYFDRNLVYFSLKNYSKQYAFYVICIHLIYLYLFLIFKWPFSKWKIGNKAYIEGLKMFQTTIKKDHAGL